MMNEKEFFDKIDTPKLGTIIDEDMGKIHGVGTFMEPPIKFVAMRYTFQDDNGTQISEEFKHKDYFEEKSDD